MTKAPPNHDKVSDLYKLPDSAFVRQADLMIVLPFSAATLWRLVKARKFPSPIKLSERITAWRVADVKAYLDAPSHT